MNTSFARKPFLPSERSRPTDSLFRTATALYLAHARRQSVAETIPEAGGAKSGSAGARGDRAGNDRILAVGRPSLILSLRCDRSLGSGPLPELRGSSHLPPISFR
jgi:hypothetical protein